MPLTGCSSKCWDVREAFRSPLPHTFCKETEKKPVLRKQKTTSLQGLPSPGNLLFAHSISGASAPCLCVCQVLAIKGRFSGAHLAVASAILVTDQSVNKSDSLSPGAIPASLSHEGWRASSFVPSEWHSSRRALTPDPGRVCLGPSHQREMGRSGPEVQDCQLGRKHFKIWSE